VMETATDPAKAIRIATESATCNFPEILRARLLRIGNLISPADVLAGSRVWKACRQCRDTGLVGSALAKTLKFCDCVAGEEWQYQHGADFPQAEIARVHASLKNRLVAAALECSLMFASDALANSDVNDDGKVLTVVVDKFYSFTIVPKDVERVLAYL